MNSIIKYLILLTLILLVYSCKDENLMIEKTPYTGNELRIDGYYYNSPEYNKTHVLFFYRNGVMIDFISYFSTTDLTIVDEGIAEMYEQWKDNKLVWSVFLIDCKSIQYSGWSTSVGGGRPSGKCVGTIISDTTFCITKSVNSDGREFKKNDTYHFRQFAPKPDSTNNFIK